MSLWGSDMNIVIPQQCGACRDVCCTVSTEVSVRFLYIFEVVQLVDSSGPRILSYSIVGPDGCGEGGIRKVDGASRKVPEGDTE